MICAVKAQLLIGSEEEMRAVERLNVWSPSMTRVEST